MLRNSQQEVKRLSKGQMAIPVSINNGMTRDAALSNYETPSFLNKKEKKVSHKKAKKLAKKAHKKAKKADKKNKKKLVKKLKMKIHKTPMVTPTLASTSAADAKKN